MLLPLHVAQQHAAKGGQGVKGEGKEGGKGAIAVGSRDGYRHRC